MPNDIKWVCISDLHLGAKDSLLTNLQKASDEPDPALASPVLKCLVNCMRDIIAKAGDPSKKPVLVLNGDVLELALGPIEQAGMAFERFLELIFPLDEAERLFSDIIYVPGNHDHHMWEVARETQYAEYITSAAQIGANLPDVWHVTKVFQDYVDAYFLNKLVKRVAANGRSYLNGVNVKIAYPNFGIVDNPAAPTKMALFSHGHYTESIYTMMSQLKAMIMPDWPAAKTIWEIEEENFEWIDFLWSSLGNSGKVGQGMELIYDKLQDEKQRQIIVNNLSEGIVKKWLGDDWIPDILETKGIETAINSLAKKAAGTERGSTGKPLSDDAEKGLWIYMEKYLKEQFTDELATSLAKTQGLPKDAPKPKIAIPDNVTFIYGHTHKPFEQDMNFHDYPGWVNVYNSGGWVVDTPCPEPIHGGAVILLDDQLNAVSLRMYNESKTPNDYVVRVEEASRAADQPNPFHLRITALVKSGANPWTSFSKTVAREVIVRQQNFKARMNRSV